MCKIILNPRWISVNQESLQQKCCNFNQWYLYEYLPRPLGKSFIDLIIWLTNALSFIGYIMFTNTVHQRSVNYEAITDVVSGWLRAFVSLYVGYSDLWNNFVTISLQLVVWVQKSQLLELVERDYIARVDLTAKVTVFIKQNSILRKFLHLIGVRIWDCV